MKKRDKMVYELYCYTKYNNEEWTQRIYGTRTQIERMAKAEMKQDRKIYGTKLCREWPYYRAKKY